MMLMTGYYGIFCTILLIYYIVSEDDTAELLRELQKIKKERAEEQARKVLSCQVNMIITVQI